MIMIIMIMVMIVIILIIVVMIIVLYHIGIYLTHRKIISYLTHSENYVLLMRFDVISYLTNLKGG